MIPPFTPLSRSLAQLGDPAFLTTLLWSLVISAAVFAALHLAVVWSVHQVLLLRGWQAWVGDILGSLGVTLLGLWLFFPIAALIATLFIDRIARAVERRHYPLLPPAPGSSLLSEIADGLLLAWHVLLLSIVALMSTLLLPGIGLVLAWGIGAYAIGRGLFVAVALRRFDHRTAQRLYLANRGVVLVQGGVLALAGYVPGANLFVPVIGTAAMVHLLDTIMQQNVTTL